MWEKKFNKRWAIDKKGWHWKQENVLAGCRLKKKGSNSSFKTGCLWLIVAFESLISCTGYFIECHVLWPYLRRIFEVWSLPKANVGLWSTCNELCPFRQAFRFLWAKSFAIIKIFFQIKIMFEFGFFTACWHGVWMAQFGF